MIKLDTGYRRRDQDMTKAAIAGLLISLALLAVSSHIESKNSGKDENTAMLPEVGDERT